MKDKFIDTDDKVKFTCHKNMACLNNCCKDVHIFLAPYDIVRLKNTLGISSQEFLDSYTTTLFNKEQQLPLILLRMNIEDETCPFAGKNGCEVYPDRPRTCRMYPVKENSHRISKESEKTFELIKDDFCLGHNEERNVSVSEYLYEQGIGKYNEMLEYFNQIISNEKLIKGNGLNEQQSAMFYMACYNIDKFRKFVFESSFLNRFETESEEIERIQTDDVELFKFGIKWLRFSLFGERIFKIKNE